MVTNVQAVRKDGFTLALFCPGFVRVERSANTNLHGMIETVDSVGGMIRVIERLTVEETGTFSVIRVNFKLGKT